MLLGLLSWPFFYPSFDKYTKLMKYIYGRKCQTVYKEVIYGISSMEAGMERFQFVFAIVQFYIKP